MTTRVICAAVAFLVSGVAAVAQLPAPAKSGFASGSDAPPKSVPMPPSPPTMAVSPPANTELPNPIPIGVPARVGLSEKCNQEPCVPQFKPKTKVIYSTTCREYCQPERSLIDLILAKCGLGDDCDEEEGVNRTKTLLVKRVVPKCDVPVSVSGEPEMIRVPGAPARISVYPQRP